MLQPTVPGGRRFATQRVVHLMLAIVLAMVLGTGHRAAAAADPNTGPGGPILVVTTVSPSNFGYYYAEILRNEGFNSFAVADTSALNTTTLANYDVVVLANMTLTGAQVTTLTNWVNGGGNLIAMRPGTELAPLLGLTSSGTQLGNAYLKIDTSRSPGAGIVGETMQYHGTADRYTLNGASSIATLYSDANTATSSPAVTLRTVGSGRAAAFTYDLARSVVYTRQGNPAWAGQERDGFTPKRSDDMFFGNAAADPRPDWVDLSKVAIPQADEQQRLFANLIFEMNRSKKPLPRFWYFPRGENAVVVMTGDDHAVGGTGARFDQFKAASPAGCSVADWECVRGTSYLYTSAPMTNAQASAYDAEGFELGLHLNTGCADYTSASIGGEYTNQLAGWRAKYTSLPAPSTMRHHCIVWSDWASAARAQLANGIRLDTDYYYWPPSWVNNVPGVFTGSAMPMRFADQDGSLIDVYQAATQMTDESGQTYPSTIDSLLDRAVGPQGYYGAYTINAHTDATTSQEADAVVASALARGVPVVSARQMLTWLDGRNESSFGSLSWNGSALSFTIVANTAARGLQAMVPVQSASGVLSTLRRGTTTVSFTVRAVKGVQYAMFGAVAGSYVATYASDTTAPTVTSTSPAGGASGVSVNARATATFSEAMDPATINSSTFELRNASNALVSASVSYDTATRTATLAPSSALSASTTYTATVRGGTTDPRVKDTSGNPLGTSSTWSFTTSNDTAGCPCTGWPASTVPTVSAESDPAAVELGVRFRSDVSGSVTGVRFYKGTGNTGTHVGNLWSSSGQRLATATFTNETATGWQQVNFATPVAITANTDYIVSYFAPNGHYAADVGFFANSGVDRAPLHLLRDGAGTPNGVYAYGASSTFPNSTFRSTNYWVDVVFTTSGGGGGGADTTPPTITARSPATGATGVATSTTVTATFSEAMDAATISSSTFELRNAANALVTATVAYNATTRVATLTPSAALAASSTYTATVRGGTTDPRVKDAAGNALAASSSWSFTTASTTSGCPCTGWPASTVPSVPADSDPDAVELGVRFRSDVDGQVTGVRFYKGTGNTGTHVGNLWSSSGQRLATATFTNETATGWQQVNFATPVAITANTDYIVSYFAPNGHYAADSGYFANSGVDRAPLHLLRDGAGTPNGVYAYGASSTFPSSTFRSTNYWVDLVFTTSGGGGGGGTDTTPPTITARSPASGATGVATSTTVTATFSEAMDAATISSSTFELRNAANTLVTATVAYNATTRVATLTPSAALAAGSTYTATVRGGTTDPRVKDAAGNALAASSSWSFSTVTGGGGGGGGGCTSPANPVVAENCLAGNPASEWDISGAGDPSIQGFATQISVNRGTTVSFKVDTNASAYRFDIYRMGYYGGMGARRIATVQPSASLPQNQPNCLNDSTTGLIDCGNWAVSGSWAVPASAVSGIYFAKLVRTDTGGASHIFFIVRNDASTSDVLFQTSDTTWQAYNDYGGNSLYTGSPAGRAYKVSYNRPFRTRAVDNGQDWVFNAEYPMVRWLEANGYDVSYFTGVDADRFGNLIRNHRVFLSVGHDEYWSGGQRANVEAARNAGVHLAFFSGNEIFWKTRWENSIDGSNTAYRTLVTYKETHANAKIDPTPVWTGTWRDPRFSPPADGGRPENALSGTIFMVNDGATTAIRVPEADGKMRFWRNTSVATQAAGATATLAASTLGYEWDSDLDNGARPPGLIRLSSTTVTGAPVLLDYGSTYGSGTASHSLTLYRHSSGARVFGAGTVQWAWGLDASHDRAGPAADVRMRQATVNLLADMNAQPGTLQSGLVAASASADASAPTSVISSPAAGATLQAGTAVTISGTAGDTGGGVVGGVEVSTDGGTTWHRANGRANWTYAWTPVANGSYTIRSRAADDSGNLESPGPGRGVTVGTGGGGGTPGECPCSLWSASATPATPADSDTAGVTLGVKFTSSESGSITGIRFYKGSGNTGTHVAALWTSSGQLLASATFANESASGWQQVNFATPVAISANTVYVASYFAPNGRYAGDAAYFAGNAVSAPPLRALADGESGGNGVYRYGSASAFPNQTWNASNYWVDVVFSP